MDNTIQDITPVEEIQLKAEVLPIIEEVPVAEPIVPKTVVAKTTTKAVVEKEIPRRYGKQQIEKDILNQGFKATPLQRAGLKLNDLKNLNVNLMNKFIKEVHLGTEVITEDDALEIIASITMLERKLAKVIKKK